MAEQTNKSTFASHTKKTTQKCHPTHSTAYPTHKKSQDPPSSTAPFPHLSRKSSFATFVPISRSWDRSSTSSTNPSTGNATGQLQNRYTTMSRWLSEPQCEQPWDAVGSVPALPAGSGTAENVAKEKKNEKKHSACATRGSASSRR